MTFLKLRQKIPALTKKNEVEKEKEPLRKIPPKVKVMTLFKATEEVKSVSNAIALACCLIAKQASRISSLIRIQIEETKRKVRVQSPAALQFIGPGDHKRTLTMKGGIN